MTALAYRRTAPSDRPPKRRRVKYRRVRVRMGELNWLALLLLASIVLLFDSLVIARQLGFIRLPGELTQLDMARSGSMAYIELARASLERDEPTGVGSAEPVLSGAAETIAHARSREEIGRELAETAAGLYSSTHADRARAANERVAALVSEDARVRSHKGAEAYILITPHGSNSSVQDRRGALSRDTVQAISKDPVIARSPETIELIVSASGVSFEAGDPVVQAGALAREIDSLRTSIAQARQDAGLAELEGPGITVMAYDAPSGYAWDEIVHQKDVLEILDSLFAAGALGAQVGGERVVATSSVRCIGPIVLVNQRPVAVNPIHINAVGNPAALERALKPVSARFAQTGKRIEIRRESSVHLSAYTRGGL
ncbi:MAG TPA: DUF881 domain-containing protein [Bacillota bacterium]|nr:DUF881 domain-containing protein [Bacillota bacterium]